MIANFLSTPTVNVLTVYLYGTLQYGPTPAVYATATIIFAATIVVLACAALLLRTTMRLRGSRRLLGTDETPRDRQAAA